jgi:hypothetical protein
VTTAQPKSDSWEPTSVPASEDQPPGLTAPTPAWFRLMANDGQSGNAMRGDRHHCAMDPTRIGIVGVGTVSLRGIHADTHYGHFVVSDARGARYDGLADWFDPVDQPTRSITGAREELASLLGPGLGPCLDLACGTGGSFDAIRSSGRTVVGLDVSADQLRRARDRESKLVRADAAALPFADGAFSAVVAAWMSTDVDDLGRVLAEAARVLRTGGVLVLYGAHPCFNGPAVGTRGTGRESSIPATAKGAGSRVRPGGVTGSGAGSGCDTFPSRT